MTQQMSQGTKDKVHAANMALHAAWMALFDEGLNDESYMIHKAQNWVHCISYPDTLGKLGLSLDS